MSARTATAMELITGVRSATGGSGLALADRVEAILALKHRLTRSADYDEGWFACVKEVHRVLNGGEQ